MDSWLSWHALVGVETRKSEADMADDPSSGGVMPAWMTELLSSANLRWLPMMAMAMLVGGL